MNKKLIALVVVIVLAVAVAVVVWPRGGTPVAKHEVVTKYRESSTTTAKDSTTEKDAVLAVPEPGVYTYSTTGQETVKLGPFPAETREFPAEVAASLAASETPDTLTDAKCFSFELNLIAEHVERSQFCAQKSEGSTRSLQIASHVKNMKMGPASPEATLTCDPKLTIAAGADLKDIACVLSLGGGPMEVKADLLGSVTVGEIEEIVVGGTPVETRPVSIDYVASGKVSGTWSEKIWFSESDWLPVRIVRQIDLSGPASISESSELNLKTLEPST